MGDALSFHPTWTSAVWIAAATAFGLALLLLRTRWAAVLVATVVYLAVPCGVIAVASSNPVLALNGAAVTTILAFTYYLHGWVALAVATVAVLLLRGTSLWKTATGSEPLSRG